MSKASRYSAPALEKGLEIVEFLCDATTPKSQAEIAQGLGRSPNEIYRVLVVLESRGYLVRNTDSGKYGLSLKLFTLAHSHSFIEELRQAAKLPMLELAEKIGQSCHLSVPYDDSLLVISQVNPPHAVSLSISQGTLFPLFTTVSGRILLAHFSEDRLRNLLSRDESFAAKTNAEKSTFLDLLGKIRETGIHTASSEITLGVTDCAAFVGQAESELMAVVAVSSLTSSLGVHQDQETIQQSVTEAARAINRKMGVASGF
jgi:DNA-binding IclR family transcriptional regulator